MSDQLSYTGLPATHSSEGSNRSAHWRAVPFIKLEYWGLIQRKIQFSISRIPPNSELIFFSFLKTSSISPKSELNFTFF